jgi:hypothetical protein
MEIESRKKNKEEEVNKVKKIRKKIKEKSQADLEV